MLEALMGEAKLTKYAFNKIVYCLVRAVKLQIGFLIILVVICSVMQTNRFDGMM